MEGYMHGIHAPYTVVLGLRKFFHYLLWRVQRLDIKMRSKGFLYCSKFSIAVSEFPLQWRKWDVMVDFPSASLL